MAQAYNTLTKQVTEDITVTVSKKQNASAGERLVAFLKWVSEKAVDPGYGVPEGGSPPRPDQGLPGGPPSGNRPDNSLPGSQPGPDNSLPGSQPGPDNSLPGSQPGIDNSLPGGGLHPSHPIAGIGNDAEAIAKIILGKCFECNIAQPK